MLPTPEVICADSLEWMLEYDDDPFDAVITDPPYGIAFMGKDWDRFENGPAYWMWCIRWMRAMLGVVKPGAHAAIFGSPKLFGWQATALEIAGWELRDTLAWMYGQGFPKSLNLRGDQTMHGLSNAGGTMPRCDCGEYEPKGLMYGAGEGTAETRCANCGKCPPEPTGKNGWGTALKPAWEPILLARAPMVGKVQANFDVYGTGAMNINASRIPLAKGEEIDIKRCECGEDAAFVDGDSRAFSGTLRGFCQVCGGSVGGRGERLPDIQRVRGERCECENYEPKGDSGFFGLEGDERSAVCRHCGKFRQEEVDKGVGRWPANVALDEEAAALLDAAFRTTSGMPGFREEHARASGVFEKMGIRTARQEQIDVTRERVDIEGDDTRPSRFFYIAKASKSEREAGLGGVGKRRSDGRRQEKEYPSLRTSPRRNDHPTVKPIDLGKWLTRMLAPEGGRVLDPFSGSGSFGIAAGLSGVRWTGIERSEDYAAMSRIRIDHWIPQERLL